LTGPTSSEPADGDRASNRLLELAYTELRDVARRMLGGERSNHTLQPTALLHEAWLRLSRVEATWQDQGHFVRSAAGVMRRVLVEHARARGRERRGGGAMRITLAPELLGVETAPEDLIAMDTALVELSQLDPQLGAIVELGVFGGLSHPEVARLLDVSLRTVERGWRMARAFLAQRLGGTRGH
jgi:RNA polymerase sigma factor (TIGR02999 family)